MFNLVGCGYALSDWAYGEFRNKKGEHLRVTAMACRKPQLLPKDQTSDV
jgi:hypothetical protein